MSRGQQPDSVPLLWALLPTAAGTAPSLVPPVPAGTLGTLPGQSVPAAPRVRGAVGPPQTALGLSRSHPSDEKDFSFPRNISAGSLGSLLVHHHSTNHVGEGSEPAVTEPLIAGHAVEHDTRIDVEREVSPAPPLRCVPSPPLPPAPSSVLLPLLILGPGPGLSSAAHSAPPEGGPGPNAPGWHHSLQVQA